MVSSSSLIDLTTRNRKSYASADAGAGDDTAGVASRVFSLQTGERDHRGVVGAVTLLRQTNGNIVGFAPFDDPLAEDAVCGDAAGDGEVRDP